ncbi:MAG: hypothetical protein ABJC61_03485 [Acidobacteriota bacterium]
MRSAAVVLLLLVSWGPLANWVKCVPDCCAASEDGAMPACAAAQSTSPGDCRSMCCFLSTATAIRLNDRPAGVARNSEEGFDFESLNLRVSRRFSLTNNLSVEAILEGFNVLNRKNYQLPNNSFGSPTFGQPTAVNDPRQLQLGAKVSF